MICEIILDLNSLIGIRKTLEFPGEGIAETVEVDLFAPEARMGSRGFPFGSGKNDGIDMEPSRHGYIGYIGYEYYRMVYMV